jgi:hypothetical protein
MTSETVLSSLPPAINGNGLFAVNQTLDASGNFAEVSPSNSYSYPLMDPARLIGTPGQPFMNVALPAYIATLYQNTYKINDNLKNVILTAAQDNREYPTSYAVQQYVQSQVAGTQIINGASLVNGNGNTYVVNTTTVNTIIQTGNTAATGFSYVADSATFQISLYWMDVTANPARNGASKTVMFSVTNYLTTPLGAVSGNLAFLYAGNGSKFLHMGKHYNYYQFVVRGDFLDFIQSYNASSNTWEWIVKDSLGVFCDEITVASPSTISDNAGSTMPVPAVGLTVEE